jgi:hypothetical protein
MLALVMLIKKTCSCGRTFTPTQWRALPLVGIQQLDGGVFTDMRNCPDPCGSTLLGPDLTVARDWLELSGLLQEAMREGKRVPIELQEAG